MNAQNSKHPHAFKQEFVDFLKKSYDRKLRALNITAEEILTFPLLHKEGIQGSYRSHQPKIDWNRLIDEYRAPLPTHRLSGMSNHERLIRDLVHPDFLDELKTHQIWKTVNFEIAERTIRKKPIKSVEHMLIGDGAWDLPYGPDVDTYKFFDDWLKTTPAYYSDKFSYNFATLYDVSNLNSDYPFLKDRILNDIAIPKHRYLSKDAAWLDSAKRNIANKKLKINQIKSQIDDVIKSDVGKNITDKNLQKAAIKNWKKRLAAAEFGRGVGVGIVVTVAVALGTSWAAKKIFGIGQVQEQTHSSIRNFPSLFHHGSEKSSVESVQHTVVALGEFLHKSGMDIASTCLPSGCKSLVINP